MVPRGFREVQLIKILSSTQVDTGREPEIQGVIAMPMDDIENTNGFKPAQIISDSEFDDLNIQCIDCATLFVWTAGEQLFFRDKKLQNPPKRCKQCKKAKNQRLEAIAISQATGIRQRIEVAAKCARCEEVTTIPFYPSQGRPVYCRSCFAAMNKNGS